MSAQAAAVTGKNWIRNAAIYVSALLFTSLLLPATVVGWYYADPQSLGSALGTAIDYAAPVR